MNSIWKIGLCMAALLALAGCDNSGHTSGSVSHTGMMSADSGSGHPEGHGNQGLQTLLAQALLVAAHGADMKLKGDDSRGQALLSGASSLLRRAMSGPEMAMMHKGGAGMSATMKRMHAIGDGSFDLLGLMMTLNHDSPAADRLRQLNSLLGLAASANSMALQARSAGALQRVMQDHAAALFMQINQAYAAIPAGGNYYPLVGTLIQLLQASSHDSPAKS